MNSEIRRLKIALRISVCVIVVLGLSYSWLTFQMSLGRTRVLVIQDIAESADEIASDKELEELIHSVQTYYPDDSRITSRAIQEMITISRSNAVVYIENRRLRLMNAKGSKDSGL